MKKWISLSAAAAVATVGLSANTEYQAQIDALNDKIKKLEQSLERQGETLTEVKTHGAKDNLKFDVDFRTAVDYLEYETVGGTKYINNNLLTNRLWLGMKFAPSDTMSFNGQLAMHKAFGASYGQRGTGMGFDTFDWVINENLTDETIRLREAYWIWKPSYGDYDFSVSVGRRPSTNGYLANLREDDESKSPLGHVINMEFDGASASIKNDQFLPGLAFKLCLGRGLTNAVGWSNQATYMGSGGMVGNPMIPGNYAKDESSLETVDMAGFIFTPYNDGQYAIETTYYRGFNVPGMFASRIMMDPQSGMAMPDMSSMQMMSAGDMDGAAISFKADGIGDGISDFLDESIFFASFAWSKSNPDDITRAIHNMGDGSFMMNNTAKSMLGSEDSETGSSVWVGLQVPNMLGGKFGLEYNQGSEYWRPFTYGEDTLVGSKLAVRGQAYEAYFTQPLMGDYFSMQVRYTYIDYEYTGSNGFFGDGGAPTDLGDEMAVAGMAMMGMDPVETAQDLRVYLRYRY